MNDQIDDLLHLAGKMADAARAVVGGYNFTIGIKAPPNVYEVGAACVELRKAVDAYDAAVMALLNERKS